MCYIMGELDWQKESNKIVTRYVKNTSLKWIRLKNMVLEFCYDLCSGYNKNKSILVMLHY